TLQGRIRCGPLAEGADAEIPIPKLGDVAATSEQGFDEAALAGFIDGPIQPRADAGEALEVMLDEGLGLLECDPQLARQRQRALTVNRGEVARLRAGAHLPRDALFGAAKDGGGGLPVDIAAALERRHKRRV